MKLCDPVRRLFGAYWDDEVTQAEREWLESHLAGCPECRQHYEQLTHTLEAIGSLPRIETAADLPERVLVAARRAAAIPDRVIVTTPAGRWLPAAAAAAVLIVGAATLLPGRLPMHTAARTPSSTMGLFAPREMAIVEPHLVAAAVPIAGHPQPAGATRTANVADSLFDHSEDVEFILDPVVLQRGRAQTASRLPPGIQGEQTVISY